MKWIKGRYNLQLNGENFHISYNPDTVAAGDGFAGESKDDTALETPTGEWLILNGDFREEYEKAFPKGYAACLAVYKRHAPTKRSSWSTD